MSEMEETDQVNSDTLHEEISEPQGTDDAVFTRVRVRAQARGQSNGSRLGRSDGIITTFTKFNCSFRANLQAWLLIQGCHFLS